MGGKAMLSLMLPNSIFCESYISLTHPACRIGHSQPLSLPARRFLFIGAQSIKKRRFPARSRNSYCNFVSPSLKCWIKSILRIHGRWYVVVLLYLRDSGCRFLLFSSQIQDDFLKITGYGSERHPKSSEVGSWWILRQINPNVYLRITSRCDFRFLLSESSEIQFLNKKRHLEYRTTCPIPYIGQSIFSIHFHDILAQIELPVGLLAGILGDGFVLK